MITLCCTARNPSLPYLALLLPLQPIQRMSVNTLSHRSSLNIYSFLCNYSPGNGLIWPGCLPPTPPSTALPYPDRTHPCTGSMTQLSLATARHSPAMSCPHPHQRPSQQTVRYEMQNFLNLQAGPIPTSSHSPAVSHPHPRARSSLL